MTQKKGLTNLVKCVYKIWTTNIICSESCNFVIVVKPFVNFNERFCLPKFYLFYRDRFINHLSYCTLRHLLCVTLHSFSCEKSFLLYKLLPRFAVRNWFGTRDCNPRRNIRQSRWRRRRAGVRRAPCRASIRPGKCCRYLLVLSSRVFFLL